MESKGRKSRNDQKHRPSGVSGTSSSSRKAVTPEAYANLPYRPGIGLVILNHAGHIFAGRRIDNPIEAWQMPQGGIDHGETPAEAALRELTEETGILPNRVDILRESDEWRHYDLPPHLVSKLWRGRYRGQKQRWFVLRFHGTDSEICIDGTAKPEFCEWAWMPKVELSRRIVPFKRKTYARVFAEFADLLG